MSLKTAEELKSAHEWEFILLYQWAEDHSQLTYSHYLNHCISMYQEVILSLNVKPFTVTDDMINSLNDILMSEKDEEEIDNTENNWSNNRRAFTVLRMRLKDTVKSSALCEVLRWNQLISVSDLYDADDDPYKDTIIFCYISSEKSSHIHHSHDDEAKSHQRKGDAVLYWIDMIENEQFNLLFVNVKEGYMKSAAVNTQDRNM